MASELRDNAERNAAPDMESAAGLRPSDSEMQEFFSQSGRSSTSEPTSLDFRNVSDLYGKDNVVAYRLDMEGETISQASRRLSEDHGELNWKPYWEPYIQDFNPAAVKQMTDYSTNLLKERGFLTGKDQDLDRAQSNAIRHALVSAFLAWKYGEKTSAVLGDTREALSYGDLVVDTVTQNGKGQEHLKDHVTDFHNNKIGRNLGLYAREQGMTWQQAEDLLVQRVKMMRHDGRLPEHASQEPATKGRR